MSLRTLNILKNLKIWGFKTNPFNKKISGIKNLMSNGIPDSNSNTKEIVVDGHKDNSDFE